MERDFFTLNYEFSPVPQKRINSDADSYDGDKKVGFGGF